MRAQKESLERDEKIHERLQKLRSVKDNVSSVQQTPKKT